MAPAQTMGVRTEPYIPFEPFDHPDYRARFTADHRHKFLVPVGRCLEYIDHGERVGNEYVSIVREQDDLFLDFSKGYAWNLANKPAFNNLTILRGSAVHDPFYQLVEDGHLVYTRKLNSAWKDLADDNFKAVCLQDGMSAFRAWYAHRAVKMFGSLSW